MWMVWEEGVEVGATETEKKRDREGDMREFGWMEEAHLERMSTSSLPRMPMWALIQCRWMGREIRWCQRRSCNKLLGEVRVGC